MVYCVVIGAQRLNQAPDFAGALPQMGGRAASRLLPICCTRGYALKSSSSLRTLTDVLTRSLVLMALTFSLVSVLSWALAWFLSASFSPRHMLLAWLISLVALTPLVMIARRHLLRLIGRPLTHLIANTQLGGVRGSRITTPATSITEISLLSRSILHMTTKILQREMRVIDSERRLSLALSGSGEGVWDWDIERNLSYIDDNCCAIIGVSSAVIKRDNRLWLSRLHPDDIPAAKNCFRRVAAADLKAFDEEYRVKRAKDADWQWIQIRGSVVEWDSQGNPVRMAGTISDVTQRKNTEQQLKLYSTAFMCTKNAVAMLDRNFIVLAVNRAFCEVVREDGNAVIGRPYRFCHPTIASDEFHELIRSRVHSRTEWLGEAIGRRADGSDFPQDLAVYGVFDDRNELTHYVAIFSDITERKRVEEDLRILANHDPLTGLPNRYMFNATFDRSLQSAKRKTERLALMFIDLDHFKLVNDMHGHEAGDRLLIEVARRIRTSVRATDTAARLAGDEFVVILEDVESVADVEQVARKIIQALAGANDESCPTPNRLSASIGISLFPEHGQDVETLLRKADRAMYEAKTLGRNRSAFFDALLEGALQ